MRRLLSSSSLNSSPPSPSSDAVEKQPGFLSLCYLELVMAGIFGIFICFPAQTALTALFTAKLAVRAIQLAVVCLGLGSTFILLCQISRKYCEKRKQAVEKQKDKEVKEVAEHLEMLLNQTLRERIIVNGLTATMLLGATYLVSGIACPFTCKKIGHMENAVRHYSGRKSSDQNPGKNSSLNPPAIFNPPKTQLVAAPPFHIKTLASQASRSR